jgi:hypothetical protein
MDITAKVKIVHMNINYSHTGRWLSNISWAKPNCGGDERRASDLAPTEHHNRRRGTGGNMWTMERIV